MSNEVRLTAVSDTLGGMWYDDPACSDDFHYIQAKFGGYRDLVDTGNDRKAVIYIPVRGNTAAYGDWLGANSDSYYGYIREMESGFRSIQIFKRDSGVATKLAEDNAASFNLPDDIYVEYDTNKANEVQLSVLGQDTISASDEDLTSGAYMGLFLRNLNNTGGYQYLDNADGGDG